MGISALQTSLKNLRRAIAETDAILEEMRAARDPLAFHIFTSRQAYRTLDDHSKSGHHKARQAEAAYRVACDLGYRGSLQTWYDLVTASPKK